MKIPYPLPLRILDSFLAGTDIRPLPGYSIRFGDSGVHYLIYGSEDLLQVWSLHTIVEKGRAPLSREIAALIGRHQEKMTGLGLSRRACKDEWPDGAD